MNTTDIILLLFTAVMLFAGWKSGFVRSLGSLLALAASVVAAFYTMNWIRDSFGYSFTANPWFTIITFVSLVVVAHWLAMYIVEALDLARKVISIIPFVNFVNSILGALLGDLEAPELRGEQGRPVSLEDLEEVGILDHGHLQRFTQP